MGNNGGGRKPMPLHLVNTESNHLSADEQQVRQDNTPKGCSAKLTCPKTLSDEAKKEWRRVVKLYKQLDAAVINDLDVAVLAAYCEAVAVYKAAQAKYVGEKMAVTGLVDGKIVQNPYITVMDRQIKNILRLSEQLCMSPVGRARIGVARERDLDNDPMGVLLSRSRPKTYVQQ